MQASSSNASKPALGKAKVKANKAAQQANKAAQQANEAAQQAADDAYLADAVYEHLLLLLLFLVFRLTIIAVFSAEFDKLMDCPQMVLYQIDK